MGDTDIGRLVGRDRTTVREWRMGRAAPTGEAKRELVRLFRQRGGGELPGQMSPGSTGAAIPSIAPRKRGRPSKAEVAARTPAPITADELLRKTPVHRVAPPTRVIDHMAASDKPQPAKPAPKAPKVPWVEKAEKVGKPDGRRRPRPTPAVMAAQGRVLAEARKALGLTQVGAGLRAHIAAPTFGNYETGTAPIPPTRYDALAAALNLPADWHRVTP